MGYFAPKLRRGHCRAAKHAALSRGVPADLSEWLAAPAEPPRPDPQVYVRLTAGDVHPDSGQPRGIFLAAYALGRSTSLPDADARKLRRTLRWFEHNLPVPRHIPAAAVFWFRSDAGKSMWKAWALVRLLRQAGAAPRLTLTRDPGRVVYQDELQIAATPGRPLPGGLPAPEAAPLAWPPRDVGL